MALLNFGKGKHDHNVSRVVCDQCGIAGLLPRQLHPTLYKVNPDHGKLYYCETHMILNGLRPVTPDFMTAMRKAQNAAVSV